MMTSEKFIVRPTEANKKLSFVSTSSRVFIRKNPVGFWWANDPGNHRPDSWCTACNELLREEGGEWNSRSESFADIQLLCAICYDSARELNFPQWRQFFN